MSAKAAGTRVGSLRARVLRHVMLPLAFTWLAGTLVALLVANYFTQQAFDRSMLDDAHSIATNMRPDDAGHVQLLLSPREVTMVLFDQVEVVYYAVLRPDGSLLSGYEGLRPPAPPAGANAAFADIRYRDQDLRSVVLAHDIRGQHYLVVVAQTTHTRAALLGRLLVYATGAQTVLMLMLAVWLWRGIATDLAPLGALQRTLDRRDANDLSPVSVEGRSIELDRLRDALNGLLQRLGRSAKAQREFAGNVAHELRTPLAGIRALADYGLSQAQPQVWHEQLARIVASESRASRLVDQLLALALADEAAAVLAREPVRLDRLVGEAVLRHLARADAKGVDLGARGIDDDEGPPRDFTVQANTALVEGILDNLIDNALRYGGSVVTVELSPDGRVLSVLDDGPGIPSAAQRDLMQRWAQGPDGERLGQGAGLGLSIVARYAQLLGARLVLSQASAEGGLRVSVHFDGGSKSA